MAGFEGGQWADPKDVLRTMYGGMGLSANAPYRDVDRARARAIAHLIKRRAKTQPPVVPAP